MMFSPHLQTSAIRAECELVASEHCDSSLGVTELSVSAEAGVRTRGQDEVSLALDDEERDQDHRDHDHGDG